VTLTHYIWWCLESYGHMKGCINAIYIDSDNMNLGVLRALWLRLVVTKIMRR